LNLLTVVIGLLITGIVTTYGFLVNQNGKQISDFAKSKIILGGRLCFLLAAGYVIESVTTLATVLGTNFKQTFAHGVIQTYLWDLIPSRFLLISAVLALIAGLWLITGNSLNSIFGAFIFVLASVGYPLVNSHSVALGNHSLAIMASIAHAIAMSIWVGTVVALIPFIRTKDTLVVSRFSRLATSCVVTLLVSGIVSAATRMQTFSDLFNAGYGQLVLLKIVLFLAIAYFAIQVRKSLVASGKSLLFVLWEISTMAVAVGVGVALHFTPPSRTRLAGNSAAEDILGFNFPPPPSAKNYLFGWYPDWAILTLAIFGCTLYIVGVIRLRNNEIAWPIGRTLSFMCGIATVIWVSCAGISRYAMISFSAHMIQHMVLAMLVPIFIVLGAPITLALRALPTNSDANFRSIRTWLVSLLHSRYSRIVTKPLLVLFIFSVSLYGLYFTSLFSSLMGDHTGHIAMSLHFLVTGILFCYLAIGVDPTPNRLPYWGKLLLVLVSLSIHAFFALAIMQSESPLGDTWYRQVQPPWLTDPLLDTHTAGGIAWAIGEIPMLALLVVIAIQWARADQRSSKQQDRAADRDNDAELSEYNKMLANLNRSDSN
ncbi:MAG: bifunctional copper resistance protein CopD/cytochrome c oxidase assembly protein, partial [Actinomycetales bacterium]|nr:bifunctional copper resistance protein CopD/cytochrome c oxidase assembly protein [Actinomycetales bacterium]